MPTVAKHPSLKSTQAIGAVLLHQFARQRFIDAGVDEELIQDAEDRENLDHLTAVLLQEEDEENDLTKNITNCSNEDSTLLSVSQTGAVAGSINSVQQIDSTLTLQNSYSSHNLTSNSDQYLSLNASNSIKTDDLTSNIDSTIISTNTHNQENTLYHSIDEGHDKSIKKSTTTTSTTNLDNLQSLPIMAIYGRELRKIADEFEKNRLRKIVKEKANHISLNNIGKETFIQLLEELFQGGITRERIVILFFFCTDVALRAVSFGQELVVKLIQWSFSYIINTVCKIVHSIGGWDIEFGFSSANWDTIIFKQLPSILISCCAALGILALVSHLNKNLRA